MLKEAESIPKAPSTADNQRAMFIVPDGVPVWADVPAGKDLEVTS